MNLKHKILRIIVNLSYLGIRGLNNLLEYIREKQCKHPQSRKGTYSWAPGHTVENAGICTICDKIVDNPYSVENMKIAMSQWDQKFKSEK